MNMATTRVTVALCLESNVLTSKQLQAATGIGQPVVSEARLFGVDDMQWPSGLKRSSQ